MQIIGAGFGRSGTMSLKVALERLGYKPCYHMLEVLKHPSHIDGWLAAAEGKPVDWDSILGGYEAGVDYPLSPFYKELMAAYPNAKVILSVRDPQRWYESTLETIYQGAAMPDWLMQFIPPYRNFLKMVRRSVWERLFDGRFEEREYAIQVFNEWIEDVKRTVPREKLLIFNLADGWDPLCEFLGAPIPKKPFPHINSRSMTRLVFTSTRVLAVFTVGTLAAMVVWLVRTLLPI
jgi:hypothetical protein